MTVKDLIDRLSKEDPSREVIISYEAYAESSGHMTRWYDEIFEIVEGKPKGFGRPDTLNKIIIKA